MEIIQTTVTFHVIPDSQLLPQWHGEVDTWQSDFETTLSTYRRALSDLHIQTALPENS